MSSSIDQILMSLKIHDVEVPFDLPNEPEFCSMEETRLSLIGRILNPQHQSVTSLVQDMPRKWSLQGKVRGVVLSEERFQFIFQDERKLEEILEKAQTYNQWSIVLDRWMENPPGDYLQYIPVWIQLRDIPIKHKTAASIKALGAFAGKVIEVPYDPLRTQSREFVRVRVRLDVSNPVRRTKVVNLPFGGQAIVRYDFERLQKRCYTCQRLTHDQEQCPIFLNKDAYAGQADFWVWEHTKSGDYNVKSGYWLANKEKNGDLIRTAETLPNINAILSQVWKLMTPLKIRNILWRAMSNAIPVADCLIRRGVKVDTRCQICGLEGESTNHVLFVCSKARQLWAVSNVPWPQEGYHQEAIYVNMSYVLGVTKNGGIPLQARRSIPWILWLLWKNRNCFLFEGRTFNAMDTIRKIWEEAGDWFLAKEIKTQEERKGQQTELKSVSTWKKPPLGWFKCNVGVHWCKKQEIGGGAWVIRDDTGRVILHSRRAFGKEDNKQDLITKVLSWAIESVVSHRMVKVMFALQDSVLVGAMLRPGAWPNFKYHAQVIKRKLIPMNEWRIEKEEHKHNLGAFRIAQCVTLGLRVQSYVARSYPLWLQDLFLEEAKS